MSKPKKILWPTDFSELSFAVVPEIQQMLDDSDAELHLVHVCPPQVNAWTPICAPYCGGRPHDARTRRESALIQLKAIVGDHFKDRDKVVCTVLEGEPWHAISDYSKEEQIELIVIATHGLTGLTHVLMGSTAERLVQHAQCPVLTIKAGSTVS